MNTIFLKNVSINNETIIVSGALLINSPNKTNLYLYEILGKLVI